MRACEDLVRVWCERFQKAAEGEPAETSDSLPLSLHRDATVAAAYHINWPDQMADKLSGLSLGALEIQYIRMEERKTFLSMTGHYRRQLKLGKRDTHQVDQGMWLDSMRAGSAPGKKRSIDVLITKVEDDPERPGREEEDLIIEILVIEFTDPGAAEEAPATATTKAAASQ
jgi:hypothetical protein